jgi:NADPH:quinone reductase
MRAVTIPSEGALVVAPRADPVPGRGELLVAVRGAGLNNADLIQREGNYPAPAGSPPDIPGLEFAGEVLACGPDAQRFAPGDRIMALVGGGGQAEQALVHERCAMPVPDSISWAEAGGFPEAFITAHDALFTTAGLSMGERVLVTGAAGGVGIAAVQLAHCAGATVVASVHRPERHDQVASYGADVVITPEHHAEEGPYDVILEMFPAQNLATDVESLATGGRIHIVSTMGGRRAEFSAGGLMGARGRISGASLRARPLEAKAEAVRRVEHHTLGLLGSGALRVPVHSTFPLESAELAYESFAAGAKLGKIVLVA